VELRKARGRSDSFLLLCRCRRQRRSRLGAGYQLALQTYRYHSTAPERDMRPTGQPESSTNFCALCNGAHVYSINVPFLSFKICTFVFFWNSHFRLSSCSSFSIDASKEQKKNINEMFIMFSFYLKRKNMPPSWNSIVMIEAGTFVPLSKKMELDSYILIQC